MPEMLFHIRWPDGRQEACYSPSTIVAEHLAAGADYPLAEFVARSNTALAAASERVRARFGMGCARAVNQAASIQQSATSFTDHPDAVVRVERFDQN